MTIRVVIADDQPLLRSGFKALIDSDPDLAAVGEAGGGRALETLTDRERQNFDGTAQTMAELMLRMLGMPADDAHDVAWGSFPGGES